MIANVTRKEFLKTDKQLISRDGNKVTVICGKCNEHITLHVASYWRRRKTVDIWRCHDCLKPELIRRAKNNPLYKDKDYRDKFRDLHKDPEYYKKVHNKDVSDKISKSSMKAWKDPKKRESHLRHRKTKEFRDRISEWSKKKWSTTEYRQRQQQVRNSVEYHIEASKRSKKLWSKDDFRNKVLSHWNNPEYRDKLISILDKYRPMTVLNSSNVSKLQKSLYLILDDLGLSYEPEGNDTVVQFINRQDRLQSFIFDCMVQHSGKKLYIECHGNYFHSSPRKMALDISKSAYRHKHLDAELLVLWEAEFRDFDSIRNIIKTKLGIGIKQIDFKFNQISIKEKIPIEQVKVFFARYHYLANMGRFNSYSIGGYIGDELVACALYNVPTRSETARRLGLSQRQVRELTRFCIHPSYQKKNFASWFLSKTLAIMRRNKEVKRFVAFSDLSRGHDGIIYKASNWKLDGHTDPDYWYIDDDGLKIHKKSIWNRAKSNNMSELEYAKQNDLEKVYYPGKLRYVI